MTKKILVGIFIVIGMISCNNEDDNSSGSLSGIYTETSPVNGRTQLNFTGGNTVIKIEDGSSTQDQFTYEIVNGSIILTPNWDNTTTAEFEFEIMDNSKFKIENLYPTVGINPTTYMIFEK